MNESKFDGPVKKRHYCKYIIEYIFSVNAIENVFKIMRRNFYEVVKI